MDNNKNLTIGTLVIVRNSSQLTIANPANEMLDAAAEPKTQQTANTQTIGAINDLYYNAVFELDVTATPAPPSLPRARFWHVNMVGPIQGQHDYRRYFYLSAIDAHMDDERYAVASWVIEGKRVFFEYYHNGNLTHITDLTDINGNVMIASYRPITSVDEVWYFGASRGTSAFPDNDNIHSILDINVRALNTIVGDSFNLSTIAKDIVGAINEIYSMYSTSVHTLTTFDETPDNLAGRPGDVAITPYGIYTRKMSAVSTGFLCSSSDARFDGIWSDMGANNMNTISGISLGTHWYLHESGNYVLVWSNYNANPSVPRAGYWFINNAGTPRLDSGALLSHATVEVPSDSTGLPPDGFWGGYEMNWQNYTSTIPSQLGWALQFNVHSTPDGRLFVGEREVPMVYPMQTVVTESLYNSSIASGTVTILQAQQLTSLGITTPNKSVKLIFAAISFSGGSTTAALSSMGDAGFTGSFRTVAWVSSGTAQYVDFSLSFDEGGDLIITNNGINITLEALTLQYQN